MRNIESFRAEHLLTGSILSVTKVGTAVEVRPCLEPGHEKLPPIIMLARPRGIDYGYRFVTRDPDSGQLSISFIEEYEITEAGPRFVAPIRPLWQPDRKTLEVTASLMNTYFLMNGEVEYQQVTGSVSRRLNPEPRSTLVRTLLDTPMFER